ncbi:MAG: hypothetical protein HY812_08085 [Planctomycetes bacterium]|nr:hypothetical protein [Planctomycetota bacterium]
MSRYGLLPLFLVVLAGCDAGEKPAPAAVAALPDSFFLSAEPAGAKDLLAVRAEARDGEVVAVRARARDFVASAAVLTLVDRSIPACGEKGADSCATPWDFCCEDQAEVARASATVEFRKDGELIEAGLQGFHGLDHLRAVVVAGIARRDAAGNLTVLASGIWIAP